MLYFEPKSQSHHNSCLGTANLREELNVGWSFLNDFRLCDFVFFLFKNTVGYECSVNSVLLSDSFLPSHGFT